jgi:hypothetical protein
MASGRRPTPLWITESESCAFTRRGWRFCCGYDRIWTAMRAVMKREGLGSGRLLLCGFSGPLD